MSVILVNLIMELLLEVKMIIMKMMMISKSLNHIHCKIHPLCTGNP